MNPPTVYLIRRGLTEEKIEKLRELLSLTPLAAVVVTTVYDAAYAALVSEAPASILQRPIAIIGDFEADLTELGEKTVPRQL
jgi:hypothetical protein